MKVAAMMFFLALSVVGLQAQQYTIGDLIEGQVQDVEEKVTSLADAVPDSAYDFVPSKGEFAGVRTFGEQLKHIAATNKVFASALLGRESGLTKDEMFTGPKKIRTKADIVQFLKQSFALCHVAANSVSDTNFKDRVLNPLVEKKMSRLGIADLMFSHTFDHYGQIVVYARMNGIIPPDTLRRSR